MAFTRLHYNAAILAVNVVAMCALLLVVTPPESHSVTAAPEAKATTTEKTTAIPEHIKIPSLAIDLPVTTGIFDPESRQWTLDESGAFWADYSEPPNVTSGITLIYAHARWGLFGALPDIVPGAETLVSSQDGHTYTYSFESATTVEPEDTTIFTRSGAPHLVLQTCSGTFSQNRTLYSFSLLSIENPS